VLFLIALFVEKREYYAK